MQRIVLSVAQEMISMDLVIINRGFFSLFLGLKYPCWKREV